jgi:hypothetical protein
MLTMLETFQKNETVKEFTENNPDVSLFDRLKDSSIITFYFVPLDRFGLTEDLYVRMNARGKMLNDFENFKSEFYKIINCHEKLCKDFKDKIEYDWVRLLWDFREEEKYTVDKAFMNYLRFITEMLYFKQSKVRADNYESFKADEPVNFEVLKDVFANEDNLSFLIFAFDYIGILRNIQREMFWSGDNKTLCQIIENVLNGKNIDIFSQIILYATLRYFYRTKTNATDENYYDYTRVIRNLTHNTGDKSRREWARLFESIEQLIGTKNIYETLILPDAPLMEGFYKSQREEEIFKARVIKRNVQAREIIFRAEDNDVIQGNIAPLLRASYTKTGEYVKDIPLSDCVPENFEISKLEKVLDGYEKISDDDFMCIWGDTLITEIYGCDAWRIRYKDDYKKHDAMIQLVLDYNNSKYDEVDDFAISIEKDFIKEISKNGKLAEIKDKQQQLYIYYILTVRIMEKEKGYFFRNGCNFGFLKKEQGFSSLFNGIDGNSEYIDESPIYQTYSTYFRYSYGLQQKSALPPEIDENGISSDSFDRLIEWCEKE